MVTKKVFSDDRQMRNIKEKKQIKKRRIEPKTSSSSSDSEESVPLESDDLSDDFSKMKILSVY